MGNAAKTLRRGWCAPQAGDLAVAVDLVVLEHCELDLLVLVLDLLGLGVLLLLALLASTTQAKHKVEGGLLLDVVVRESASIFELFSGKDEALLIRWDSFLILDLGLYVVDGIRRLYIKSDGLSGKGLYKDLHSLVVCSLKRSSFNVNYEEVQKSVLIKC